MNAILSLFLCLATLLTGAGNLADPAASASRTLTVSNLVVNGLAVNPSATIGITANQDSALLDFYATLNGENLIPVQAKIDASGLAFALGDSDVAHLLPAEAFDEAVGENPVGLYEMMAAYMRMVGSLTQIPSLDLTGPAMADLNERLTALMADVPATSEDSVVNIHGEEQPAVRTTFTIDNDHFLQMIDVVYETFMPDFFDAYMDFINAMTSMGSVEIQGDMPDLSGVEKFSDLMATLGEQMSADVDALLNEAGYGVANIVYHFQAEGEPLDIPMTLAVYDANSMDCTLNFDLGEDAGSFQITMQTLTDGNVQNIVGTVDVSMPQDSAVSSEFANDKIAVTFNTSEETLADGVNYHYDVDLFLNDAAFLSVLVNGSGTAAGDNSADFSFDAPEIGSLSFHVDETSAPIADRVDGKEVVLIDPYADSASPELMNDATDLIVDVQKLLQDESVAALMDLYADAFSDDADVYDEIPSAIVPEDTSSDVGQAA